MDQDAGLSYFRARWYDPELGRFYSLDPLAYPGLSPYSYCYNNPTNFVDPSGLVAISGSGSGFTNWGWMLMKRLFAGGWGSHAAALGLEPSYQVEGESVDPWVAQGIIGSGAADWEASDVGRRVPGHWARVLAGYYKVEAPPGGTRWGPNGWPEPWEDQSEWEPYYDWAWVPDVGQSRELTPEGEPETPPSEKPRGFSWRAAANTATAHLLGPIIMVRSPWPPDLPLDAGMAMATAADYAYIWGGGSIIAGLIIGNVPGVIGGIAVGVPYLSVGVFMTRQTYLWYKNHPNRGVF